VSGYDVDALLPPRVYSQGLCIPQTFHATLEFRRTVYELRDRNRLYGYPLGYVEQHHARIRWSRFALLWAAIGAQLIIEHEVSP
jgi:hypothetical protein